MNNELMFSSKTNEWETPNDYFNTLNSEFNFTLDPCATSENAKCEKYFTKADDGLKQNWGGETVFCNPPYGRQINKWVKKCYQESQKPNTKVVMLIPARTDTKYFHEFIYDESTNSFKDRVTVKFLKGRLKFGNGKSPAPFPSMLVIFGSD